VHADPHPGNILVQPCGKDFKIILLDHGLYAVCIGVFSVMKILNIEIIFIGFGASIQTTLCPSLA